MKSPVDCDSPTERGACEYLVSFGRNGGFGRFISSNLPGLRRGTAVILQTARGLEQGSVLCRAESAHARLLSAPLSGQLLRIPTDADRVARTDMATLEQNIFERGRQLAVELRVPIEILDVEIPLQREQAILQYLGDDSCDLSAFLERLTREFALAVRLENLALAEAEELGCGEENCGKKNGGCTSCSSGGCSSCGSNKFDIRGYFSHLREKMEGSERVAIL